MAEVQLALQRGPAGFEKLVVVKLVHDNLASQKAFVDMLLDEARVAALVKHPNVVDIYDLGQANGRYFIAMEYLEGEPLLAVLRAGRDGKRLDPLSTGRLIADTAEGLDAAHELRSMSGEHIELVHHDISLGNIVVLYTGQVKLVDFGVAKASQSAKTQSKVQGKFSYMAPEKLKGAPGDRRSDIFSLGCVMWEALTLKRLFRGSSDGETMRQVLELAIPPPSRINSDVPAELDPIVVRALDRDPNRRQLTAKELAVDIEEVLRKHGYGAKNDRVARYMQETFKPHIDARKKLVQEVVAKGSASAEVVDAAFAPAPAPRADGSGRTPTAGEFSARFPKMTPQHGTPVPPDRQFDTATVIDDKPPDHVTADPADLETQVTPAPELGARALLRKPWLVAGGAMAAIAVIAIIAIAAGGSGRDAASTPPPVAAPVTPAPSPSPSPSPSPTPSPIATAPAPSPTPPPPPPPEAHHLAPRPATPSSAASEAEALYRQGVQAFVKGDVHGAAALLQKAKAARPGYAPTWRALGNVYDKLGERGQAKSAFQRYLALAPNASDAASVRQRLERL
jgi:serine/threonine-protein kinase